MKVKELIQKLEKMNPESKVGMPNSFGRIDRELDVFENNGWYSIGRHPKDVLLC